jgi:hypothetical protein
VGQHFLLIKKSPFVRLLTDYGVKTAGVIVFLICLYAFLLGNKIFSGLFENDEIAWYFLAKGIFCSVSLFVSVDILEAVKNIKNK